MKLKKVDEKSTIWTGYVVLVLHGLHSRKRTLTNVNEDMYCTAIEMKGRMNYFVFEFKTHSENVSFV